MTVNRAIIIACAVVGVAFVAFAFVAGAQTSPAGRVFACGNGKSGPGSSGRRAAREFTRSTSCCEPCRLHPEPAGTAMSPSPKLA